MALDLGAKAGRLIFRVVKLGEAVRKLPSGEKELKAVRYKRIDVIRPRQRGDEGGIQELVFDRLIKDVDLQLARAIVFIAGDAEPLAHAAQISHVTQ